MVAGIVAESLLDDEAYLWMHGEMDVIENLKLTFVRMAKRFIDELPYLVIRGHTAEPFLPFIQFLGGKVVEGLTTPLIPFEIRKEPWQTQQP